MAKRPVVCVCVPVWNASEFVHETLHSVLRQRDVELNVLISVDGADALSAEACAPFLADPRCTLAVQPERLDWVNNIGWLLTRAEGDYVCIQPHDDLIDETYLATLLDVAERRPEASVVYSDIATFGDVSRELIQSSVTGSPFARQLVLLLEHFNAVAFRGLTRIGALREVGPITGNRWDNFAVDTIWLAQLARAGELHRVPAALYHKRYHAGNTHTAWANWDLSRKIEAWAGHCADMLAEALSAASPSPVAETVLTQAALMRSVMALHPMGGFSDIATLDAVERRNVAAAFIDAARTHPLIPWERIAGAVDETMVGALVASLYKS